MLLERQLQALEEACREEQAAQELLQQSGVCPVGYNWIKQYRGYRCASGSHWLSDGEVQMLGRWPWTVWDIRRNWCSFVFRMVHLFLGCRYILSDVLFEF